MDGESDSNGLYFLLMIYRVVVCHTENTEIIFSHTDHTDLTDFYIPQNFLIICPTESWIFNGPTERAEMTEIYCHADCGIFGICYAETQRALPMGKSKFGKN